MTLNIENIVRSGVVLAIGLPVVLSVSGTLSTVGNLAKEMAAKTDAVADAKAEIRGRLAEPCLRYIMAKPSSKLEDKARIEIDEIVGGDTMHGEVCRYVLE